MKVEVIVKVSPLEQLKKIKAMEARFSLLAEGKITVKDCTAEELRAFQVMMYDAVEQIYEPIMVQPNNYNH
jgi:hypothetical protein